MADLAFKSEGRVRMQRAVFLCVIPTSAIEMITVSPAPKKLPTIVIHCAPLLKSRPVKRKSS
jgi:hypothetical protein